MNILILTQYYAPDIPGVMPSIFAHEMKSRGHRVRVVTAVPNYSRTLETAAYSSNKRVVEVYEGIEVMRVPIFRSHNSNPLGRITSYISFILSARAGRSFVEDADVIYVHGTPATAAEPARSWHKSLGTPFVYQVQDIWPESVIESGFLPSTVLRPVRYLLNKWLGKVYTSAAAVIAIAPTARQMLIERGVPAERAHIVYNYHLGDNESVPRFAGGLALLYAGNLGDFQDLETVIRAASRMKHLPDFKLRIAGDGVLKSRLMDLVVELGAEDTITFVGRVVGRELQELYESSDYHVVPLKNIDIFTGTVPSKFQAGLAHGLPVITTVPGDVSNMVRENQLGYAVQPESVDELAESFLAAYNTNLEERMQFSNNAKSFYEQMFTKKSAMDQLESILESVVNSSPLPKY